MFFPLRDDPPTRRFAAVTAGLIAANVAVWIWELRGPGVDFHVVRDGYYPCTVSGPCHVPAPPNPLPWYEGTFSSMFMHASWLHIAGNMVFLWIFGNNIEDRLGRFRFLLWYLVAGIAAMATQTAVTLAAGSPAEASIPNVGASGAIAAVLGAYLVLYPRARVLTFIFVGIPLIRNIRAYWFLGVWIALQLWTGGLSVLHPETGGGGTAFFAHIGGFAFGVLTILLIASRRAPARATHW
jgi:membrane associated rhomboid family serine protease